MSTSSLPAVSPTGTEREHTRSEVTWSAALHDPLRSRWSRCAEFERLNGSLKNALRLPEVRQWFEDMKEVKVDELVERAFEFRYVRLCPICAKDGLHVDRHQSWADVHCPFHEVELTTACPYCGAAQAFYVGGLYGRVKCTRCRQRPLNAPVSRRRLKPFTASPLEGWHTHTTHWLAQVTGSDEFALVPTAPKDVGALLADFYAWLIRGCGAVWVGNAAVIAGRTATVEPAIARIEITRRLYGTSRMQVGCPLASRYAPKGAACLWEQWFEAEYDLDSNRYPQLDRCACLIRCQLIDEKRRWGSPAIEDHSPWEKQNPYRWATLLVTGEYQGVFVVAQIAPRRRPGLSELGDAAWLPRF